MLGADETSTSLLYGEILPVGIDKALNNDHLDAENCACLLELGSGLGKLAIQAFFQFSNITKVEGIEFSEGRYKESERALTDLTKLLPSVCHVKSTQHCCYLELICSYCGWPPSQETEEKTECAEKMCGAFDEKGTSVVHRGRTRTINFEHKDLFLLESHRVHEADIIILETDIPVNKHRALFHMLSAMRSGARLLTYIDLSLAWGAFGDVYGRLPYEQLPINIPLSDRFATTWSPERGHHFFLWRKF